MRESDHDHISMTDGTATATASYHDDIPVVHVAGEVDIHNTESLQLCLARELAEHPKGLVVDLLDVRFLGSAGLHVLLEARDQAAFELHLVAFGSPVPRVLQISGLNQLFRVHPAVPDALDALTTA